jgi:hypothetical protein
MQWVIVRRWQPEPPPKPPLPIRKWNPRRAGSTAFRAAHGVDVESLGPDNLFVVDLLRP